METTSYPMRAIANKEVLDAARRYRDQHEECEK